jgi:hypothetical protein
VALVLQAVHSHPYLQGGYDRVFALVDGKLRSSTSGNVNPVFESAGEFRLPADRIDGEPGGGLLTDNFDPEFSYSTIIGDYLYLSGNAGTWRIDLTKDIPIPSIAWTGVFNELTSPAQNNVVELVGSRPTNANSSDLVDATSLLIVNGFYYAAGRDNKIHYGRENDINCFSSTGCFWTSFDPGITANLTSLSTISVAGVSYLLIGTAGNGLYTAQINSSGSLATPIQRNNNLLTTASRTLNDIVVWNDSRVFISTNNSIWFTDNIITGHSWAQLSVIGGVGYDLEVANNGIYTATTNGVAYLRNPGVSSPSSFTRYDFNNGIGTLLTSRKIAFKTGDQGSDPSLWSSSVGSGLVGRTLVSTSYPSIDFVVPSPLCTNNSLFIENITNNLGFSLSNVWTASTNGTITASGNNANATFTTAASHWIKLTTTVAGHGVSTLGDQGLSIQKFFSTTNGVNPTTQASALNASFSRTFSSINGSLIGQSAGASWTRGNGSAVLVLAKVGGLPANPVNINNWRTFGTYNYGLHPSGVLPDGSWVIYAGTGSNVSVSVPTSTLVNVFTAKGQLTANIGVRAIEYNNCNGTFITTGTTNTEYFVTPVTDVQLRTSGLEEPQISEELSLEVYGFADFIRLISNKGNTIIETLEVYEISGKLLRNYDFMELGYERDLNMPLKPGTYIVKMTVEGKVISKRVVIGY